MVTILVTGAGGGVGISVIKAARLGGYRVIACDMNPLSAGLLRADIRYVTPPIKSANYIPFIIDICVKEKVDAIIPGSDHHLQTLADQKKEIEKNTDAKVIVGTWQAVAIGRSKSETQRFLRKSGLRHIPTKLVRGEVSSELSFDYPMIVKPEHGSGSVGLFKVNNKKELDVFIKRLMPEMAVVQKCISSPEEEYTTGVMFSIDHKLLGSITLKRELKKGDSYRTWSGDFPEIRSEMEKIGKRLDTCGPLNLQCRMTDEGPVVFEINPRFSGTTCVRAYLGFNDVKMVVENFLYGTVPESTDYKKGVCMVRYLNEIYITEDELARLERGHTEVYL